MITVVVVEIIDNDDNERDSRGMIVLSFLSI